MVLCFRVKFYPTEPMKLKEEITRFVTEQTICISNKHRVKICHHDYLEEMLSTLSVYKKVSEASTVAIKNF